MTPRLRNLAPHCLAWMVKLSLVVYTCFVASFWLDPLVFRVEEYRRLIGGAAACGIVPSYCSWTNYLLDLIPDTTLAVAGTLALAWRGLRHRDWVQRVLAIMIVFQLVTRFINTYVQTNW